MELISQWLVTYIINALWIVCIAAAAAWLFEKLLNRGPAAYRHALWVAAQAIAALLPLSSLRGFTKSSQGTFVFLQPTHTAAPTHVLSGGPAVATQEKGQPISLPQLATDILAACYVGFLLFRGARLSLAWRRTKSILQQASELSAPSWVSAIIDRCRTEMGIRKTLTVYWSDTTGPVTLGIRHTVLLLPRWFLSEVSHEEIAAAVSHELVHVRRHDFLLNIVYDILLLPVAFHPVTTWIKRRIDQTRELSCDEAAAEKLSRVTYARSLLSIAKTMSQKPPSISSASALGLFDTNELEERIMNLMKRANPIGKRLARVAAATVLALLVICCLLVSVVSIQIARPALAADSARLSLYSSAQYFAYLGGHSEKGQAQVKLLDDFVAQYPKSALLPYVYHDYYLAYYGQKNYPQTIEYVDKLLAFGDKLDVGMRLEAQVARAQSYVDAAGDQSFQKPDSKKKARNAAAQGLKALSQWQKPQGMTDEQFAEQRSKITQLFESVRHLTT